jgi:mRNA interferase MazF
VSPEAYNRRVGLALLCPITSRVKGYPFEVAIPEGTPISGVVLSDQVKSLDWKARRAELLCTLPDEVVTETIGKLSALLAPQEGPG